MASTIRIKKRASSGSAGAPSSLASSELAFNENTSDKKLYYGYGDNGSGVATSIIAVGGPGAFCDLTTAQTVAGVKTFSDNVVMSGNLTVNGTTTSIQTTNSVVKDALIELGNGTSGTPSNDAGLVIERGDSANAFIGWDESADKFIVGTGTFTGADTGNLSITGGTLVATTFEGALSGNASTATALANGRTIAMSGDVVWSSGSFDGSGNVTAAATIQTGAVEHAMLAADAVDGDNIADDSVNSEHYVDGSIDHAHLAGDCIDGDNIQDDVVNSEHIAAGAIDLEHMASESVDEDNLKISNSGSNGQFLSKQSGNSGGLTWASPSSSVPTTITVADESSDTTCFPLFATAATGDLGPKSGSNLTFNSSTGVLTATQVDGLIDGGTF
jgi:hypothetical protein